MQEKKRPDLYPTELVKWEAQQEKPHNYERRYALRTYILFFFTFSLIGWLWEVSLHLIKDGVFVNRGVMFGPWLPIYGSGGVLILLFLRRFAKNPVVTFLLSMVLCSVVEYATSWYLEVTKGTKWWDYSGYLFNLNGRICLEGAIVFGLGGCAFIYFLAPRFDDLYRKIPIRVQWTICTILLACFSGDFLYSRVHPNQGAGITDYDSALPSFFKRI